MTELFSLRSSKGRIFLSVGAGIVIFAALATCWSLIEHQQALDQAQIDTLRLSYNRYTTKLKGTDGQLFVSEKQIKKVLSTGIASKRPAVRRDALYLDAAYAISLKDTARALKDYSVFYKTSGAQKDYRYPLVVYTLAQQDQMNGNPKQALDLISPLARKFLKGKAPAKAHPLAAEVLYYNGYLLEKVGQKEKALDALKQAFPPQEKDDKITQSEFYKLAQSSIIRLSTLSSRS